jgi:hypothetical protein
MFKTIDQLKSNETLRKFMLILSQCIYEMQGFTAFLFALILLFSISNKIVDRTIDRNQHDFKDVFTTEDDKKASSERYEEEKTRSIFDIISSIGNKIFLEYQLTLGEYNG